MPLRHAPSDPHHLITFTDAESGADRQTGRAAGGYVSTLKRGVVASKADQQPSVTTNSFESEALQLSTTGKEVVKLRHYQ